MYLYIYIYDFCESREERRLFAHAKISSVAVRSGTARNIVLQALPWTRLERLWSAIPWAFRKRSGQLCICPGGNGMDGGATPRTSLPSTLWIACGRFWFAQSQCWQHTFGRLISFAASCSRCCQLLRHRNIRSPPFRTTRGARCGGKGSNTSQASLEGLWEGDRSNEMLCLQQRPGQHKWCPLSNCASTRDAIPSNRAPPYAATNTDTQATSSLAQCGESDAR